MSGLEVDLMSSIRRPLYWLPATCLLLLLPTGCGRQGPEMVPVEGTIIFGGGPWPKPGVLNFTVESPHTGLPNRPAMGLFDTDGRLTVTTFKRGDGLIPGKYQNRGRMLGSPTGNGIADAAEKLRAPTLSFRSNQWVDGHCGTGQKAVTLNLDVAKK